MRRAVALLAAADAAAQQPALCETLRLVCERSISGRPGRMDMAVTASPDGDVTWGPGPNPDITGAG